METTIISRTSLNFGTIRPRTAELAALECLKKFPLTFNGENLVSTLEPSLLIGSFSFLQVMRKIIQAWMSIQLLQMQQRYCMAKRKRQQLQITKGFDWN